MKVHTAIDSGSFRTKMKKGILLAATTLVLIYLGISVFFLKHFMFRTYLNGAQVSLKSVQGVEDVLRAQCDDYALTVTGRNNLLVQMSAKDISMTPLFNGQVEEMLAQQNPFAWPLSLFRDTALETSSFATFDPEKVKAFLQASSLMQADYQVAPVDATYQYEDGSFQVVPEIRGSLLNENLVFDAANEAIGSLLRQLSLDEKGCYIEPAVFSDDANLNAFVDLLNRYAAMTIRISYGEQAEVLDGETIKDWLIIEGEEVSLSEEAVKEYVASLSRAHDTFTLDREFTTTAGDVITVKGGNYGWWTDRVSTAEAIKEAVLKGEDVTIEPVYYAVAATRGSSDIGDSYVEIDLNNQHVYVYKDGEMVLETDCVSGRPTNGNWTPTGTYAITYKTRDAVLRGENYETPVKYWMPFNGNVGMHDASWRGSFGGEIYVRNGSHGCVNLPPAAAKQIYDLVEQGEAVVVYGGKGQAEAREQVARENEEERRKKEEAAAAERQQAISFAEQYGLVYDAATNRVIDPATGNIYDPYTGGIIGNAYPQEQPAPEGV